MKPLKCTVIAIENKTPNENGVNILSNNKRIVVPITGAECRRLRQEGYKAFHLYFISQRPLIKGYPYMVPSDSWIGIADDIIVSYTARDVVHNDCHFKIEATTNPEYSYTCIGEDFIELYKQSCGSISNVFIEMSEDGTTLQTTDGLAATQNGCVILCSGEDYEKTYSREELKHQLLQLWNYAPADDETFEGYLKKNNI